MSFKYTASDSRGDLVGREREIERLALRRRAASEGHGGIVLVGGEAGVGKSRLLREFMAVAGSGRPMIGSSRCVQFVQTPLGPLREMLVHLSRRESASRDPTVGPVIERLAFQGTGSTTADTLPSGPLFDSIDAAFARYALHGTVLLTIEDLHWGDRSTIAFLSYFAERIEKRRALLVATYRSDEVGPQHPCLSEFSALVSARSVSTITLRPLDEHSTRSLIERAAHPQKLSTAVAADIVRRSEGNPFFAEELLKSALEPPGALKGTELPLSIRGTVLARAAQLTIEEHKIVSLAAVLGERFSVAKLVALTGGERETVLQALQRARSLQLICDDPATPGEVAFRHALTHEVIYGELLAERVRPLHEAIALDLERQPSPEASTVELAHHWRRAGDLERASTYDELAGDGAAAMGAFPDAVLYYERAIALREGAAELEHKLGVALGATNELESAIERLRHASELYWRSGDFGGFAENASALVAQLHNKGDPVAAAALCHETIAALDGKLPQVELDLFRARIAFHRIAALDDESASTFLSCVSEPITSPRVAMHVEWSRFRVAAMRGDIDDWRRFYKLALNAARSYDGSGSWLRHIHCQIALDAVGLAEVDAAREHFRAATPPKAEQRPIWSTLVWAASAFEHTLRGDFGTAARLLRDATGTPNQSYTLLVHVKSANFVLGICSGDEARLRGDDCESFLRFGIAHGMKMALGILGGPYAWALGLRGEVERAAAWIAQIAQTLPRPYRFFFAYLAAAQFGRPEDVLAMRRQLVEAATHPQDRLYKAVLALFDAFGAQRGILAVDVATSALAAAAGFEAIGWPWLAANGYELGGESRRALEAYRSLGSWRDVRRLEAERSDASASVLSSRELEVAELVANGHSNEEIAQILHISSRTVEKHVSSALRKLKLRSRVQLGRLLARSQADSESANR